MNVLKDAPTLHHTFRHRSDREKRTYFLTLYFGFIDKMSVTQCVITLNIIEWYFNSNQRINVPDFLASESDRFCFSWGREARVEFSAQFDVINSPSINSSVHQQLGGVWRRGRGTGDSVNLCPGDNRGLWWSRRRAGASSAGQLGDQSPGTRVGPTPGPSTARSQASQSRILGSSRVPLLSCQNTETEKWTHNIIIVTNNTFSGTQPGATGMLVLQQHQVIIIPVFPHPLN